MIIPGSSKEKEYLQKLLVKYNNKKKENKEEKLKLKQSYIDLH